ncbi:hypothetical protein [Caballeronia udeis]
MFSSYPCWDLGGYATWHYDDPARSHNWDPGPEIVLTRDPNHPDRAWIEGIGWLQPEWSVSSAQVFVNLHGKDGTILCSVSFPTEHPGKSNTDLPPRDANHNPLRQALPSTCPTTFGDYDHAVLRLQWSQ